MSADRIAAWVAVGGAHPLGELTLYGPFATAEEASEWANEHLAPVGDWWVAPAWGAADEASS